MCVCFLVTTMSCAKTAAKVEIVCMGCDGVQWAKGTAY